MSTLDSLGHSLAAIAALAEQTPVLPVDSWHPAHCGDSHMRIGADGRWWHEGSVIGREGLVRLFASILRREADGGYVLVTPAEKLSIEVDDLPFYAVELSTEGAGETRTLAFRLNTGAYLVAGPGHPLTVGDPDHPQPAVTVRPGLDARIARPVYYELAELALAEGGKLWSGGAAVRFAA